LKSTFSDTFSNDFYLVVFDNNRTAHVQHIVSSLVVMVGTRSSWPNVTFDITKFAR